MEARALTRHEKASLKSFLSGVYAGVILSSFRCGEKLPSLYGKNGKSRRFLVSKTDTLTPHTHTGTCSALRKATLKVSPTSASSHERLRAGRLMGKEPQWKESLQQARLRYVKRYLDYLRRARHTKKSCLLGTHGHMVQACASVLPANQHRKIVSVDYCGAAVAECHRLGKDHSCRDAFLPARAVSFDSGKHQAEKEEHVQSQFDENNELIQDAKMRYWTLFLRGVRHVPAAAPSNGSRLSELSATLGGCELIQSLVSLSELAWGVTSGGTCTFGQSQ